MADNNDQDTKWRRELDPMAYRVTRQKGTEPPFSGEYWNCGRSGNYVCICCGAQLFHSSDKFDSGCGWPSFSMPVNENNIDEHPDTSFGMIRTEVTCHTCGAHLGHVFSDGPTSSGLRYCINSVALRLLEE